MKGKIVNFVLFQIGWFVCVLGGAFDALLIGPLFVVLAVCYHLVAIGDVRRELPFILAVTVAGSLIDSLGLVFGIFSFPGGSVVPWVYPLWMTALWANFSTTLNHSLAWMRCRYALGAVTGAIFGPLAYIGGAEFGAISFSVSTLGVFAFVGVTWAVVMPLILWLNEHIVMGREVKERGKLRVADALS